ncbi:MAG: Gfo/Idh/MocA family oxidoreductase [Planctomycetota bacterium]|nr:Gfo/Idh/MocA family oxidoreductase [Planctomycetota bacterium]
MSEENKKESWRSEYSTGDEPVEKKAGAGKSEAAKTDDAGGGVPRRDFIGAAALGAGGIATGISFYFRKGVKNPSAEEVKGWRAEHFGGGEKVRTGHIGIGNRGGSLLRTALQVPGSMPIAVCDKQASKIKDFKKSIQDVVGRRDGKTADEVPVQTSDDYRRILDNKDVEAVFIATPHYLHGPMAIDAVEAGKHVYCEKAMAFTIGENQDIVDLVEGGAKTPEGKDIVFQVGHQRHYSPLYQKAADMIHGDRIGEVATIRAQWNQNDKISRPAPSLELERIINWRLYSEYSGGLTTEFATHQIDVANWFFGEGDHVGVAPHSVRGYGGVDWYYQDARDTHDNVHLIFTYKVPAVQRDAFGRVKKDSAGKFVYEKDSSGGIRNREVTFDYMCTMANAHVGPSELMLGRYGTIQVSLAGGEFWKEKKARQDESRIAEGTNPRRSHQKKILKSGATMAQLGGKPADQVLEENPLPHHEKHWSHFIEPIEGAYDKIETLLAVESFHKCVRLSRAGSPFNDELRADARVGMNSAIAALMANIAMREDRTVYWDEFSKKSS